MRRWMLLGCCLVWALQAAAQKGFTPVANVELFKQQFAKAAQQTQTIKSDFVQEKHLSMLSEKVVSKGKFWFKKENKVRMEYASPTYYLMVINGKNFRIKDARTDKNISASGNKLFEQISKITADCVQGNVLGNKDFSAKVLESPQSYLLQMTPVAKGMKDFFASIDLLVDKKDLSVVKITMHERSGDDTVISFVQKETNVAIPDELFALK
ncbi:outer membrane lipoprotein carrier protein LolA [Chitinophaga lutea]|uniref:Outer membrane lipoprotein carrier protein LolA n=1 Tax=Chitinophaga lutea TaxID=2488634 RepID=A0A3N4PWK0_9BACT|nr:outer membrane lipoprotein carrier protein LolA [Chitinophaga lutea]RPE09471.1 outer membrane lipoprotein carrier protein LolA [Chitinophaga lutea]